MNKEDAKKRYGENLKRLRIARGMSQEELAKALGYTNRSSINKIEIGRSNIPTDKIARTAEVLGVSPLELFDTDETEVDLEIRPDNWLASIQTELTTENLAKLKSYAEYLKSLQDKED